MLPLQYGALIQVSVLCLLTDFHRIVSNLVFLRFLLPYQFLLKLAIFFKLPDQLGGMIINISLRSPVNKVFIDFFFFF